MAFMTPSALDECDTELDDLRRLSAIVISLQRQAQTQGPVSAPSAGDANFMSVQAPQGSEFSQLPRLRYIGPMAATGFTLYF